MTLEEFAKKYDLKVKEQPDGELQIVGKNGRSCIYQWQDSGGGILAFMLMPPRKSNQWGFLRKHLVEPSFRIVQDGDWEGCAIFEPNDTKAVSLVLKVCRIHRKRHFSPEHTRKLTEILRKNRRMP